MKTHGVVFLAVVAMFLAVVVLCRPVVAAETVRNATADKEAPNARATTARPATVLLITSDALADAWKPFARWKTRLGKATKIVTIGQIDRQYEGADVQQKIRACCLEHIRGRSTRWVVLGGDSRPGGGGVVPDRDTRHRGAFPSYDDLPTDLYYVSAKDWDTDKDGVYGEWKDDRGAIAYTDTRASIGRIPVRTAADVAAYTAKVIAYETKYPAGKFAREMVYTCPVRGAYPKLGTSRGILLRQWKEGRITPFYASQSAWGKGAAAQRELSPDNWVTMINSKTTGKLHMHGHGYLPAWVLGGRRTVDARHVARLTNRDAYPVITTVSCFTGHYDAKADPSIGESMLRRPGGGAVLIVAPSREGVPVFHDPARDFRLMITEGKMDGTTELLTRFWRHGLAENLTAGEALRAAKADMAADAVKTAGYHFVLCELNLLGDPTLDLRAKDPRTPRLDIPASIAAGRQTVKIATDVPGATVCLWKGHDVYEVATTGAQGTAQIAVDCKSPGKLLVTVTGASLNAALGEIEVRQK